MNNIKNFLQNKKYQAIMFFGFYLVFFTVLLIMMQNKNVPNVEVIDKTLDTISINTLINMDNYEYHYLVNDNGNISYFDGLKDKVDYLDYEYHYFFDIYHLNQIIKKSKIISDGYIQEYEIDNKVLNELLNTNIADGTNKILIDSNANLLRIYIDLSNYLEKDIYYLNLEYRGVA